MIASRTPVDVLRSRAERQADHEALTYVKDGDDEEVRLTYGQLDRWSRAVAAQLQSVGHPGSRILLVCPSGLDFHVAYYGCLYAGMVVVPVQAPAPGQSLAALESAMAAVRPAMAITTRAVRQPMETLLENSALHELRWVLADAIPEGAEGCWQEPATDAESLSYLFLTSGSTSSPKAVMHSHRTIMSATGLCLPTTGCTSGSRMVNWIAPHFSLAMQEAMFALVVGFPITLLPTQSVHERPVRWLRTISRTRATHSAAPNYAYDLCVRLVSEEEKDDLDLSCLERLNNGGEQVRPDTLERFTRAFAACGFRYEAFSPTYGLSEGMVVATRPERRRPTVRSFDRTALEARRIVLAAGESGSERTLVSSGPPLEGETVIIVDPDTLEQCCLDEVGEIWVAGPNVGIGYWERPVDTERIFRAYLRGSGEGPFLRTGELGFLHEGELFIAGRQKELIITGGRKIDPQDIELTVQRSHLSLQSQAGAAFATMDNGQEHLTIVQEVDAPRGIEQAEELVSVIRRAVGRDHAVQAHAIVLVAPGSIPRTASGKTQRAACRTALLSGELFVLFRHVGSSNVERRRNSYVSARSDTEAALITIWEQVLGTHPIGVHDTFVDLGGDSLLSLQVLARLQEKGIGVSMEQIFRCGTIAALARATRPSRATRSEDLDPVVGPVPLLPRQRRILEHGNPTGPGWISSTPLTAFERLDPVILDRAAKRVVAHHEALRLRFKRTDRFWEAEIVAPGDDRIVSFHDLSHLPPREQDSRMAVEQERLRNRIDITRGPLLQIGLFRLGSQAADRGLIVRHYSTLDPYSLPILLSDLEVAYAQLLAGQQVRLPPNSTSVKQWAERLTELVRSDAVQAEATYWLDLLRNRPTMMIKDCPAGHDQAGSKRAVTVELGVDATRDLLRLLPQTLDVHLADALRWAVARALADRTKSRSIVLDVTGHGREPIFEDIDLSRTIGPFTTIYPVHLDINRSAGPVEGVLDVRAQLEGIPRHGIGYEALRHLGAGRLCQELRAAPECGIRLNYQGDFDRLFGGLTLLKPGGRRPKDIARRSFRGSSRVEIDARIRDAQLRLHVRYHDNFYRRSAIEEFAASVVDYLLRLAACSRSNADRSRDGSAVAQLSSDG